MTKQPASLGLVGLVASLSVLTGSSVGAIEPLQPRPSTPAATPTLMQNGTYLYGETGQPNQMGQSYVVFETHNNQVIGAMYMPFSSFDCFYGQVQTDQLAMTVINTYTNESYPHAIALERATTIASTSLSSLPQSVNLKGFQAIDEVSANDQRILEVCKAAYPDHAQ